MSRNVQSSIECLTPRRVRVALARSSWAGEFLSRWRRSAATRTPPELIKALRELDPTIQIDGIGGSRMAGAGATIVHETVGNAAMGWQGALRAVEVVRLLRDIRQALRGSEPQAGSAHLHRFVRHESAVRQDGQVDGRAGAVLRRAAAVGEPRRADEEAADRTSIASRASCRSRSSTSASTASMRRSSAIRCSMSCPIRRSRAPTRSTISRSRRRSSASCPARAAARCWPNLPHLLDVGRRDHAQFPIARFLIPTTGAVDAIVVAT